VIHLVRLTDTGLATFGHLVDAESKQIAVTLELPWKDNAHGVSCIPAGTYTAKRRFSPRHHGEVFGLVDVPDRSDIEIHAGNFAKDSLGCILLGSSFGEIDEEHCILDSRRAFSRFMASMVGVDELTLTITDPAPLAA
jgi:hypothetical protein